MLTHPATETPARAVLGHSFAVRTVLSAERIGRSLSPTHTPSPMEMEACPSPHLQGSCGAEERRGRPSAWRRGSEVSAPVSPPPHALECHQSLGAPRPREGISLTLLHCSCCGAGDRCATEGCCPGWQRRLRGRGFLFSIKTPWSGPEHGSSTCSKSLVLPHCPAEMLKGQHSAVQPWARVRPQQRGSPNFPRLRRIQGLFSAEGPWAARGQQDCTCHRYTMGGECLLLASIKGM